MHSARLVLDQTLATVWQRGGGAYLWDSAMVYPQVSAAQCPPHRPWVPEACIHNPPKQLCRARFLVGPGRGLVEHALGNFGKQVI